jgi:hypothetical protein
MMFFLPFNGLPSASKVFLPIATGIAQVTFLKNFISFGRHHNNLLSFPMALLFAAATTSEMVMSQRYRVLQMGSGGRRLVRRFAAFFYAA